MWQVLTLRDELEEARAEAGWKEADLCRVSEPFTQASPFLRVGPVRGHRLLNFEQNSPSETLKWHL